MKSDLSLVRRTIDNNEIYFSDAVLEYLGKCGDWADTDRILALYRQISDGLSLMERGAERQRILVASALIKVSKDRLVDLLSMDIDLTLRPFVMCLLTRSNIGKLGDEALIRELNSSFEDTRTIAALKIVQSVSSKRVIEILRKYTRGKVKYYYNVAHWLDLGASMPREYVREVSRFEIAKFMR